MNQPRHSPHGFGVLSLEDVPFLKDTLSRVAEKFRCIDMIELGVANGGTTIGVYNWCRENGYPFMWQGLDMECGKPDFPLDDWGKFYSGDFHRTEIQQSVRKPVNLLFIDGCHCRYCVTTDFFMYSPFVKHEGFILFHDTCSHPKWQNHHVQCRPDRMIETRRALKDLGLAPLQRTDYTFAGEQDAGKTQGMMLFQKV